MGDEVTVGRNRPAHVRRERPNALNAGKRRRFLDVLAATANAARAAEEAGATVAAFYRLRQRDAGFAAAWVQTLDEGYQRLEQRLLADVMGTAPVEPGNGETGQVATAPFDPRLALEVLKRRDGRAAAPAGARRTADYRHVPIADVERELMRRLDALEKRLRAAPSLVQIEGRAERVGDAA